MVHTVLNDAGLKTVTVEEAAKLRKQGWTLIDVRLKDDYDRGHAEGAISVPLYRYVEGKVRGSTGWEPAQLGRQYSLRGSTTWEAVHLGKLLHGAYVCPWTGAISKAQVARLRKHTVQCAPSLTQA